MDDAIRRQSASLGEEAQREIEVALALARPSNAYMLFEPPRTPLDEIPVPGASPPANAVEENRASSFRERLVEWINGFDAALDQTQEVGVRLVSFGQTVVFRLTSVGYYDPSLISFKGVTEDRNPVELIQHVSQISILLMALPRKDPSQPKRPIGF